VSSSQPADVRKSGPLSSVVLYITDVERSVAFYCSVFGWVEAFRIERDEAVSVMLRPEGDALATGLLLSTGRLGLADQPAVDSFGRIIFRVDDAHGTWEKAIGQGGIIERGIETRSDGLIMGLLRDPDGIIVEVAQVGPGSARSVQGQHTIAGGRDRIRE
jgi:catechol 2,3-dioxygenase-like lactoylglutathione lyase family enzyme